MTHDDDTIYERKSTQIAACCINTNNNPKLDIYLVRPTYQPADDDDYCCNCHRLRPYIEIDDEGRSKQSHHICIKKVSCGAPTTISEDYFPKILLGEKVNKNNKAIKQHDDDVNDHRLQQGNCDPNINYSD